MIIQGKIVGSLIRKRRIELNLTQAALSKRLGWSGKNSQYLSNCELGKNPFPVKHIKNMSSALLIDPMIIVKAMTQDYDSCLNNSLKP